MSLQKNRLILLAFIIISSLFTSYLLNEYNHDPTNDFKNAFYRVTRDWLEGETQLYDENSRGFWNAPWHILILAPFALFSEDAAYILYTFVSLGALIATVQYWIQELRPPHWLVFAGIFNLSTFALLYAGQMDTVLFVGVTVGYWAVQKQRAVWLSVALALLLIKPQNVALPMLLFLYSVRSWPLHEKLKSISLPVGLVAVFIPIIGWDWPLRFLENLQAESPVGGPERTIWGLAVRFDVPLMLPLLLAMLAIAWFLYRMKQGHSDAYGLCLALATNFFVSPYVHLHHYVILVIPLFYVTRHHAGLAAIAILALWTPLLNLVAKDTLASGVLYQIILYGAILNESLSAASPQQRSAHNPPG